MSEIVEQMFPPLPSDDGSFGYGRTQAEEDQVRIRKRFSPGKYYESMAAEADSRWLSLEGNEIYQNGGIFSCCQKCRVNPPVESIKI